MPELSSIGIPTAFAAGAISFLSPCVLPLVPGYVSYVAGASLNGVEAPGGSYWLLDVFPGLATIG